MPSEKIRIISYEDYEAILIISYIGRDIFGNFCIGYSKDNFFAFCPLPTKSTH